MQYICMVCVLAFCYTLLLPEISGSSIRRKCLHVLRVIPCTEVANSERHAGIYRFKGLPVFHSPVPGSFRRTRCINRSISPASFAPIWGDTLNTKRTASAVINVEQAPPGTMQGLLWWAARKRPPVLRVSVHPTPRLQLKQSISWGMSNVPANGHGLMNPGRNPWFMAR